MALFGDPVRRLPRIRRLVLPVAVYALLASSVACYWSRSSARDVSFTSPRATPFRATRSSRGRLRSGLIALSAEGQGPSDDEVLAEARAAAEEARRKLAFTKAGDLDADSSAAAAPPSSSAEPSDVLLGVDSQDTRDAAQALLSSPALRRAADVVTVLHWFEERMQQLGAGPGGEAAVAALAERACTVLELDDDGDWSALVGDEKSWDLAGLSGPAAKEALRGAAELCTLGRDVLVEEVKVRTRDSSRILG
ncbi:unnamed protein product, partial [Polarella glacialis]